MAPWQICRFNKKVNLGTCVPQRHRPAVEQIVVDLLRPASLYEDAKKLGLTVRLAFDKHKFIHKRGQLFAASVPGVRPASFGSRAAAAKHRNESMLRQHQIYSLAELSSIPGTFAVGT